MSLPLIPHKSVARLIRESNRRPDASARNGGARAIRALRRNLNPSGNDKGWLPAGITALVVLGWLAAVLLIDSIRFVVFNPRGKTGFEMFLALGQMFGALVLALSPVAPSRSRMTWFAGGLLVLGVGALGFGYLLPLLDAAPDPNVSMYGSLFVRTLATILIAIAMVPSRVPSLGRRGALIVLIAGGVLSMTLYLVGDDLPRLVRVADMESLVSTTATRVFPGLSGWHLGLGLIPLAAASAAAWGAIRHYRGREVGGWMVVGVVLLAGAQLHSLFWPSMYSSVLTTTSVLRFGLTVIVIAGGVLELRSLSLERAALLADEKERVQQLEELGKLKRDFTSIVAHELATPLAAIRNLAHLITLDVLTPEQQQQAAARIQGEARILQLLVRDMQASADVERDDFTVYPRPVPLCSLIEDAQAYAGTVQAEHPLTVDASDDLEVLADPDRIGQVIRNLLNNAVRHTPTGTPITLRAVRHDEGVRIEVADRGPGIAPADQARILEKFGRGSGAASEGRGLGLYLSQRILQAHGSRLTIESEPGQGACFSFILEECP